MRKSITQRLERSDAAEGYDGRDLLIDHMLRCCIEAKATVPSVSEECREKRDRPRQIAKYSQAIAGSQRPIEPQSTLLDSEGSSLLQVAVPKRRKIRRRIRTIRIRRERPKRITIEYLHRKITYRKNGENSINNTIKIRIVVHRITVDIHRKYGVIHRLKSLVAQGIQKYSPRT